MAFGDQGVALAGLLRIDFPGRTVRLSDGGMVKWGADEFKARDAVFGQVQSLSVDAEGIGDLAPGGTLVMQPDGDEDAATLSDAAMQGSALRMWLAEYSPATGLVVGTPDLFFDGIIDVPALGQSDKGRVLAIDFISNAEVLFLRNQGNVLNGRWHQRVTLGEKGLDNANGITIRVAWGVTAPPEAVSQGRGFGSYPGGYEEFVRNGIHR